MKRALTSAALAAIMALGFAGPVAVATATPAAAHDRYDRDHRDYDRRGDHDRGRHRGWDRHDRDYDNWDDRRDERRSYRDGYRDGRYADRGYYSERRHWRRGEYIPRHYWNHYRVVDYRHHHLRAPPRGYHYRYDHDRGEYLLMGVATGFILGVIAAH